MLICDISIANKYGKKALDHLLAPLGVSWREMAVLLVLREMPEATHALLTQMLQTDKGNVTKLLNRMHEKGFLSRAAEENDARVKRNTLTDLGKRLVPSLKKTMARWEGICFQGLSQEQIEAYRHANTVIMRNTMDSCADHTKEEEIDS